MRSLNTARVFFGEALRANRGLRQGSLMSAVIDCRQMNGDDELANSPPSAQRDGPLMTALRTHGTVSHQMTGEGQPIPDRIGVEPAFVRRGETSGGATRIADVLRGAETLDPLGLGTLLTLGFPLGERTVFREIRRLSPGEVLDTTGSVRAVEPLRAWSRTPSVEDLRDLFVEACRRRLPKQAPLALLSGGRDSRMILHTMMSLGVTPERILTSGTTATSDDAVVATEVARRLGQPIEYCPPRTFDGAIELARHEWQSFDSLEHGWIVAVAEKTRASTAPIFDGIGLGVLSTGTLLEQDAVQLWNQGRHDELARWVIAHGAGTGERFRAAARSEGYPIASTDEVRHELVATLRSLTCWANPLGAFSLFHWSRRGIAVSAFGLLADPQRVIAPFCDSELAQSLLALDIETARAQDWREQVLRLLWPDAPRFSSGKPLRPRVLSLASAALKLRNALRRMRRAQFIRSLPLRFRTLEAGYRLDGAGVRATFNHSAVTMLASLDAVRERAALPR